MASLQASLRGNDPHPLAVIEGHQLGVSEDLSNQAQGGMNLILWVSLKVIS